MKTFTSAHLPPRVSDFLATNPVGDVRGSGAQRTALMPFTGEELFSFPTTTPEDVAAAVTTARAGVGQGLSLIHI